MPATITYLDKAPIPNIGVSTVRTFLGPANLKIIQSGTNEAPTMTDNFPSGLTEDDLFGAVVTVEGLSGVGKFIVVYVATDSSTGNITFMMGSGMPFIYDVSEGRVKMPSS